VAEAEVEQEDDDRDLGSSPSHSPSQLAVSPDGRWFATGLGKDVYTWKQPACVVGPEVASCEVERNFLQHFVLSSTLTHLGVSDDMHVAILTEDDFSIWKFNESEGPVKTLHFPGALAVAYEDSYTLLGSPGGTFHMLKSIYGYGYHAKRFADLEGVPQLLWSYSLSHALGDNGVPGRYEITAVALCKGDFWFAIAAWDFVALTGMTLLWNLQWKESPKDMAASGPHGVARFYSDISPVRSMAFSPCKTLIVKGSESGTISFWRHLSPKTNPVAEKAVPWPVSRLEFSADGHWIVASNPSKGSARLYNTNPEDVQDDTTAATSFDLASSSSMALSADMGWLLVSSTLHRVEAWPLELRKPSASFQFADTSNGIRDLLLSPTGRFILTGAVIGNSSVPHSVALWAVSYMDGDMGPLLTLPVKGTFCCMLRVPDSDEEVLIGSRNSTQGQYNAEIYRWFVPWVSGAAMPRTAKLQASYTLPDCELLSFAFTESSSLIAGCTSKVIVVQLDSRSVLKIVKSVHLPPLVEASSLLTIGDGDFAFGSSKGNVCLESIHHSVKLEDSRCFNLGGRINTLQLSDDATELYSGSSSGGICRLSLKNFERKDGSCFTQPGATPDNEILSIALLDRNRLASSSVNGVLALWDLDDIGRFEPMQPVMIQQTYNYQARMVVSQDLNYFYVTGTLGVVEAYFVNSMTTSLQRLENSSLCREGGDTCSSSWIRAHSDLSVKIPSFLDNLPLQWLSFQHATLDAMGERPPISMRKVNLSGAILRDWRAMKDGWWSIPSIIDVTNTNFVWIPVLHGEAMRLVTDANCIHAAQIKEPKHQMTFCILRARQHRDQLCATHFTSHDMDTDALAARVMGAPLPILTQIYVDLDDFKAWLCDCPAGTFGPNGSHCEKCPLNHYCPQAGQDNEAKNLHPQPCPPNTGTTTTGLRSVEECKCLPGFYQKPSSPTTAGAAPPLCKRCPARWTSGYGSRQCHSCFFGYRPAGPNRGYTSHAIGDCSPDWFGLAFFAVLQVLMIQIGLMYWLIVTGLPINDVSKQNGRWVVSTCGWQALWILPWLKKAYPVRFRKTGNPGLDQHQWDVKTITGIGQRFVLLRRMDDQRSSCIIRDSQDSLETGDLWSGDLTLDTSQGFLHLQTYWAVLCVGRIPEGVKFLILLLLPWPFWIKAFHKKDWLVLGLAISSAFAVIVLVLASLLLAPRPAIQANLSNFRHFFGAPRALDTTERSVEVANIKNLLVQFQFFIGSRDAYYVNSNILLPLTQSHCLSFAEMIGPSSTEHGNYFVSHWWGAPFEKSMQSICKHAQLAQGSRWKGATYWCSLFSVNQWRVEEELGHGDLARSSFYLALTDSKTRATLLLLDDEAGCLTRSWCLFEVLQTCLLSQRRQETFEGLLLCTPSGVMNKDAGRTVSIDIAIATAERLVHLQFEAAQATKAADKEMIDALVQLYPGKLPAMNSLVQHHIREALSFIKEKHNSTFVKLLNELERGSGASPHATGHGPRLSSIPVAQPSLQWHAAEDGIDATDTGWFSWIPSSTDLFGWSGSMYEDSGDSENTFSDSGSDSGSDERRGSMHG